MEGLSNFFNGSSHYFIKQIKNWGEILIGVEAKNKYVVTDRSGKNVGWVIEKSSGVLNFLTRLILRSHRPLDVRVYDLEEREILRFARPFYFFFSTAMVFVNEQPIGKIDQRFAILKKRYLISDRSGQEIGTIESGFLNFFTFEIESRSGQKVGKISKKWGGLIKEIFTDGDSFGVEMSESLSDIEKALIFSTAISVDFDYFEDNQGGGSPLGIFD